MARGSAGSVERLHHAKDLMHQGKVDNARPLILALEKEANLPLEERLTCQLLKSQLFISTGECAGNHQLAEQVWQASQRRNNLLQTVDACIFMAEALWENANYKASLKAIAHGEQLLSALAGETPAALSQRNASLIFLRGLHQLIKVAYNKALEYLRQSLALHEELDNKYDMGVFLAGSETQFSSFKLSLLRCK